MTEFTATLADANKLFLDGSIALARAEEAGMRIDVPYLERTISETEARIQRGHEALKKDPIYTRWRQAYGEKTNLDSRPQLAHVLFKVLGYTSPVKTAKGKQSADEDSLSYVDIPFTRNFTKIAGQYVVLNKLKELQRELIGDRIHPVFKLSQGDDEAGGAKSYRSSASDPQVHNIPIRDKLLGKACRQAFIPSFDGGVFMEVDGKAMEVCISCVYHKDPTMLRYLEQGYDFHKEYAAKCFMLPPNEVPKPVRQEAKGNFVFASFYGSWFPQTSAKMWHNIEVDGLTTAQGVPLYDHLAAQGIGGLGACTGKRDQVVPGTFEHHIQQVEHEFWNVTFPVYTAWKNQWYADYVASGEFPYYSGFRVRGVHSKREVCNYPIQGTSFHCLLWSFIELDKWLRRNKMRTRIIGQIHDSILLDVHPAELAAVVKQARYIMTVALKEHWRWIIAPMAVEIEGSTQNWWAKKPIEEVMAEVAV